MSLFPLELMAKFSFPSLGYPLKMLQHLWLNHPLICGLTGGILMGLTTAPWNGWGLAWVALIPLWLRLIGPVLPWRTTALYGAVWGLGYHGLALSWITGIHPMTWMGVPWLASLAIALFCWLFITLWGCGLTALWAITFSRLNQQWLLPSKLPLPILLTVRLMLGSGLWCGLENLWSRGSLWWTAIAYTQSPANLPILHLAQLAGPSTVATALLLVNGLLAEAMLLHTSLRPAAAKATGLAALISLVGLHGLGVSLALVPLADRPEAALKVGIIQGNVPNTIKLFPEGWRRAIAGYTAGYEQLAAQGVEAVLTPETALPFLWQEPEVQQYEFTQAVQRQGVVTWVGGFAPAGNRLTNSLLTLNQQGQIISRYDKAILVPLGEFIPFEEIVGRLINRLSPLKADLRAGSPNQHFVTPFGAMIVSICYESAFSEHLRRQAAAGGTLFLSAANNAHYSPAMPAQHHAQDVLRAIELDRWAVRATNTGYSGIVDPHGRTLWRSGLNTYELHMATVYRRTGRTVYVRWGDWLTPLLLIVAGGTPLVLRLRHLLFQSFH